jgi:uncharacterized membrane protein
VFLPAAAFTFAGLVLFLIQTVRHQDWLWIVGLLMAPLLTALLWWSAIQRDVSIAYYVYLTFGCFAVVSLLSLVYTYLPRRKPSGATTNMPTAEPPAAPSPAGMVPTPGK